MFRTTPSALVLVVLVAFAGCNAFTSGSAPTSVTAADVPTNEAASTVTRDPPGHPERCTQEPTAFGGADAASLATDHAATLRNTSFTVRAIHTATYRNGSVNQQTIRTYRLGENHSRIHVVTNRIGARYPRSAHGRDERWTDGEWVVRRTTSGYTAGYGARRLPSNERGRFRAAARFFSAAVTDSLSDSTTCAIERFTRNDTAVYLVEFTTPDPIHHLPNASVVGNATGRAFVDSSGIVHEFRLNRTVRTDDGAVLTVSERIYFTNIGTTTVERPGWYAKAMNRTGR